MPIINNAILDAVNIKNGRIPMSTVESGLSYTATSWSARNHVDRDQNWHCAFNGKRASAILTVLQPSNLRRVTIRGLEICRKGEPRQSPNFQIRPYLIFCHFCFLSFRVFVSTIIGNSSASAGQKSSDFISSGVNQPSSACSSAVGSAPSAGSQSISVR